MLKVSRALSKSLFAAAALFFLAASFSCDNSSDSSGYSPSQEQAASPASPAAPAGGSAAAPEIQCITFKGSVQAPGALPASYAKALEGLGFGGTEEGVEGLSKSARPDVTVGEASGLEFFATATAKEDGSSVNGSFDSPTSRNFEMPLAIGKTWNIVCGIRNVSGDKKIVMSDSFQMEVTVSNSVLSHVFTLTPYTDAAAGTAPSGDIALIVNHSGNALSVSASWEDPAGLPALTVESPAASPSCIKASGVPVGNHRLAIFFKDINGISIYESVQVVTVLNGLTTETWMPESGEAAITADGFNVGNDLIQGATGDRIYVGIPAALKGNPSVTASDTNSGSAYSPLEHLQAAFEKILSAGSGSKDFKIFVSGEVEGNATLAAMKGFNARSVTIEGLDGLDESKKPKSALKGSGSGSVFAIESNVPVTLKNIKITGGKAGSGSNGGGICAISGSDLTIDSGVWITGNEADERGGGVSVAGKLLMKGGEISGNTAKMFGGGLFVESINTSAIEAEICGSAVIKENGVTTAGEDWDGFGGGLYVGSYATVTMSGGEISANTAHRGGGGARVSGTNAKFVLKGDGKITGNTADAQGGGIDANHIVELLGGEISGNTAPKGGAVIIDGTFTIGGSARIPYGAGGATGAGKNDVYVCKDSNTYKVVQIAPGGFSYAASDSAPAAVLAPQEWQRNYPIIKAPSGSDIGAYTPYFKTIDPDFYFGKLSGTVDTAKLKAALCVSNKANAADSDEQSGTKSQPFKTIAFALTKLDAGEPDEIIIDYDSNGAFFGPQSIPDTFTTENCSALTIRGANGSNLDGTPKDILNASGTRNAGSVLTVKSAVPITIKDLKITGGNCTDAPGDRSGGGIYLTAGELTLADGVLVVGNYAAYGGGVYVKEGASLFMNGTSYIGDKTQTTASGETLGEQCSNSASYGGGIYNKGTVYLGYKKAGASIQEAEWTGGVRRNYASTHGGGIYCYSNGDLKMRAGTVSYNRSNNYNGGGLCASSSEGHGIELLGGELKENYAGRGGAVYVESAFSMQGSPFIPYGLAGVKSYGKNDIYLADGKTVEVAGDLTLLSGESEIAAITPVGVKRTRKILSASSEALINDNKDKFALTSDNDGWQKNYVYDSGHYAELNSLVYVVGTQNSGSTKPDDTWGWGKPSYNAPNGTKTSPYSSVADALGCAELASATEPNTIIIAGTLKGAQTIGTTSISELSLKGYKAAGASSSTAKIDAGGTTDAGSVLTVNKSGLTVTITDLTITGGTGSDPSGGTAKNGGGIYINAGTVKLANGAVITGNTVTTNGGGVYLAGSGCALYMSGKALIGDSATSTTRASSGASNRANQAGNGAGIYNNGGSVYIGSNASGTAATEYALVNNDTDGHYGVRRNYSSSNGAGIYHAAGTLKIASGDISCNSGTDYSNGGGIFFAAGASIGGGTFSNGYAKNGGGLYIKSGVEVTLTGGASFTQNEAASTGNGGAVYQGGTFNMSGSAYIAPGSERSNDVYLASGKTVAITGALNPPSGVTKVAAITPDSYSRGRDILSSNSANATNLSNAIGKFKLSQDDDGWDRGSNLAQTSETEKKVWITSPIYVAGASGRAVCSAPPSDATKATGTKKMPYATIAAALKDTDLAYESNTITIDGTLSVQTIADTVTLPTGVTAVTLQGYKASGATSSSAKIDGGATASALSISKNLTYTIKDLQITNGSAYDGGGIYLAAGTVNLDSGALVFSNKAKANGTTKGRGAGVFVASGSALNIKDGSKIYSNTSASGDIRGGGVYNMGTVDMTGGSIYNNSAQDGGGIYNNYGTLFVRGSAIIGAGSGTTATGSVAGSTCSNSASLLGGGIFNDSSANLYFGCNSSGAMPTGYALDSGCGVRRNYASNGGGIYNLGTFKSASGLISDNLAANVGGGMYAGGTTNDIGGLGISNNQANWQGGGLYVASSKTATITAATGINSNIVTQSSGSSSVLGGGIYIAGTLTVNDTLNASSNSATITGTSCTGSAYGGCVYITSTGKFTFAKGQLGGSGDLNSVSNAVSVAKAYGGAVCNYGTFEVKGTGYVYPGDLRSNDVYLASGKCVTLPANSYSGNDGTNKIALTLETWKRGTQVLDGSYAATYYNCFKCTDTEWSVGYKETSWTLSDDLKKRVGADIYVASSLTTSHGRASGISAPPSTASERIGTKAKPYSSISEGVNACWNSGLPFTIKISGKISGADQTIPAATTTTGLASAITIEGVTGNASDIIDRNLTSAPTSGGSALTISTATPVTLKNIKITNGYSKTHGGGILVNGVKGASLTLTTGALVTANQAKNNGGGIYFAGTNASGGTANLIMNSTSQISGNTAAGTSTNGGGGVYLSYANLYMSGSSVIGDTTGSSAATSAASGHSNAGRYGGGVYAAAGSAVYVGYKPTGTKDSAYATSCGILHNYSEKGGGGINVDGNAKLYLAYGSISKNGSGDSGGGAAIQSSGEMAMSGGAMALNSGTSGGAVVVAGSFEMTAGTIGDASKTSPATSATACSNYASSATGGGGAIWAVAGSSVTISGGTIAYNYAAKYGGAILAFGESSKTTSIGISAGTISANAAATSGGGLFIQPNVTATLSGTGVIKENSAATGGAVYVSSRGKLLIAGGGSIPKDTSKKNAVYLEPSSASDGTQIKITGNMTSDSKILLDGNASYFYKKDYSALTTQSPVNLTYNYTFFEIKNTSWSVCSDGSIQPATYLTSSNIASFTPTASTEYNFRIASGVTSAQLKSFFENLCNSECNTSSAKIKPTSTLDLSEVSLASLGMTFSYERLVIQPFEMVVLPASVSATQLTDSRLVWCLSGSMDFSVPPTNTSLCSENGIVYNKSKTKLILYPGNKTGSSLPTLPNTLTTIGGNSFSCAQNLRTVNIPNTVTTIESGAFRHGKITSVSIPTSISSIPMECFLGCENLATVQLPNTLTTINSRAFQQCGISSININTGALTTIDYNAFDRGFSSTTNVSLTVPSTVKLIGSNAFASNSRLSLSFYYTSGWKKRNLSDSDIEANWSNATTSDMTGTNFTSSSGSMCNYYVKRN